MALGGLVLCKQTMPMCAILCCHGPARSGYQSLFSSKRPTGESQPLTLHIEWLIGGYLALSDHDGVAIIRPPAG